MMPLIRHIDIHYIFILHVPYENNNPNWHIFRSRCFSQIFPLNYRSLSLRSFPLFVLAPLRSLTFFTITILSLVETVDFLGTSSRDGTLQRSTNRIAIRYNFYFTATSHPAVKLLTLVTPLTTICRFLRALESLHRDDSPRPEET